MARIGWFLALLLAGCGALSLQEEGDGQDSAQWAVGAGEFVVYPYYVYPSDQAPVPGYEAAARTFLEELRQWYQAQVGRSMNLAALTVLKGPSYLEMNCGKVPTADCRALIGKGTGPQWGPSLGRLTDETRPRAISLVFAQGGGGYAGGMLYDNQHGYAFFGDWVLEPLSGIPNPKGIPCSLSNGWQCQLGTAKGTVVHELGHAFGLHHPLVPEDSAHGRSVMLAHWDYPNTGLYPYEKKYLAASPYFSPSSWSALGPHLAISNPDVAQGGQTLVLRGAQLSGVTKVELTDSFQSHELRPSSVSAQSLSVTVPPYAQSGLVRAWRGALAGQPVALNVRPTAPRPVQSKVRVFARGTSTNATAPKLLLYVNDVGYQTKDVPLSATAQWVEFLVEGKALSNEDVVALEFKNDTTDGPDGVLGKQDRNIYLTRVDVNGTLVELGARDARVLYDRANREGGSSYPGFPSFGSNKDGVGVLRYQDPLGWGPTFQGEVFWNGGVRLRLSGI